MAPTRQRSNINKSDNSHGTLKRATKKGSKDIIHSKGHNNQPVLASKANTIVPRVDTAFRAFLTARFCSAIWAYITDCDETFNYWEPLHYMLYGHGLQTWEYSPQFALRSYTYLMVQGVPAWIYQKIFPPSPMIIFYPIRCMLGLGCAVMECYLYKAICREFGIHIGRMWLIFQLFSAGMFISSTALLPSSFSMYFGGAACAAWWHQRYRLAVFLIAISALLGWPFAALVGVPIAYDMVIRQKLYKTFILWTAISAATIIIPMIVIDSSYFGRLTVAPLNIVLYNVFTSHGPNLYGTEPYSYYLINGFLNFNIVWIMAIITPVMLVVDYFFVPAKSKSTLNYPHYLSLAPFYIWLVVFLMQPHKEERFLYPIYPFISLCGAITVDIIQKLFFRIKAILFKIELGSHYLDHTMFIALLVMLISSLLGLSRIFALYRNYNAPMYLLHELDEFKNSPQYRDDQTYNVCVGKVWYLYPSSFFLPSDNFRVRFVKSEFKGILPAYYAPGENSTSLIHSYFNDMNKENEHMYFDYQKCNFLMDLDTGKYTKMEPNYEARTKEWTVAKSLPYLIAERSHKLLRAFYIPFVSDKFITYGNFSLLKRKR